ncbi:family 71 glycoside hydrolase [Melampsora larici-populina 98AG31]|uniref:Family 71 glycoside hydrolase n=1 Tax=Melampsora larici-populina (strain 98AG31 / pathotype 3-4-7) TaxID=747676 RepID=F4S897_MELLP|nr:family 71 glycoside hydrolase [Melampsora larici-populina 98AG31]EGF99146.1 family 71 glycoside hydrolase [Melampsora larici-populina 98AG31]
MKNQCSRVWPFFLVISALSFILPQAVGAFSASYDHPSAQGRATEERYAFIHHMVGNTYSYRLVDWITDLMHIQEDGFDAVALNLGPDCWQSASVALAYKAASQLGNKVQLFLSLDMTSWPQSGDADAAKLAALVNNYVNHPAQFKYRGKAFISTFAGDQYPGSFGRATVCEGWDYFRSLLTTANTTGTFFIPAFFPSDIKSVLSCVDGLYHWNSAWSLTADPVSDATDKVPSLKRAYYLSLVIMLKCPVSHVTLRGLWQDWISKLGPEKSYMSNVSPALFTNYGASSLNKQILYNTGNNYAQRWAQVSAISSIKFVQVSTYNDFGESSYIGARPHSTQLQPATTTW